MRWVQSYIQGESIDDQEVNGNIGRYSRSGDAVWFYGDSGSRVYSDKGL